MVCQASNLRMRSEDLADLGGGGEEEKVILISGDGVDVAGKDSWLPQHVHFLPKPYSATQLINAVRVTLDVNGRHGPDLAS